MQAYYQVLNDIEAQEAVRHKAIIAQEERQRSSQQGLAMVVGHKNGRPMVSLNGGGAIAVNQSLGINHLPVGKFVAFYQSSGDTKGFVDG